MATLTVAFSKIRGYFCTLYLLYTLLHIKPISMNLSKISVFDHNTPRWIVFLIDLLIGLASISAAYLLRFNFNLESVNLSSAKFVIPLVLLMRAVSFLIGGTYAGIVRYTSAKDAERIFMVISLGSLLFVLTNGLSYYFLNGVYLLPFSILIIEYISMVFLMTSSRIILRLFILGI